MSQSCPGAPTGTGIAAAGQPTKPAATNNLGSYSTVIGTSATLAAGGYAFFSASGPAGTVVLGGGGSNSAGAGAGVLTDSRPSGTTAWGVWYKNNGTTAACANAWAACGV
jgi:hypothetical protein